jgi:hypothetical protein
LSHTLQRYSLREGEERLGFEAVAITELI